MKNLKVSVAQMTCIDCSVEHNLSHAYELATEAGKPVYISGTCGTRNYQTDGISRLFELYI